MMREIALRNSLCEREKRKLRYDKNAVERMLEEGSNVLRRIPGMISKLQDAWEGPYIVTEQLSAVNYRMVEENGKGQSKVVHVNNLKGFHQRELEVCALTAVADEEEENGKVLLEKEYEGYRKEDIDGILAEFGEVFLDIPGETEAVKMKIELNEGTKVISQNPYRLPAR